jgi:outer membrane receptor for ferrienterochelin and colicins
VNTGVSASVHPTPPPAAPRPPLGDYRAYSLFHLGGAWQLSSQLTLNATVYNLLDQNFVEYAPYVSNTTTGAISYTNLYSNNQEPRRLWLSLGYTF